MIEIIDLQSGDAQAHFNQALEWIRAGYVIAAPLENGYVLLADAFVHDAVRTIHAIRGDELGVATQVLVASVAVLDGIAREIPDSARELMTKFWPGQISFNVLPSHGLSWDLGDEGRLGYISVRIPSNGFVLDLVRQTGPLAVASAAPAGSPPILKIEDIHVRATDVQGIFSIGDLAAVPFSTVVAANTSTVTVLREGAISLTELQEVTPEISGPESSI